MKRSVLLIGHGSKREGSADALGQMVKALEKREPNTFFQTGFLEINKPDILEGIDLCVAQGAEEVIVLPYFVQAGKHVIEDVPRIVSSAQQKHPNCRISLANYLAFDERIVSVVCDRISEARR